MVESNFMDFLIFENSNWDEKPLVNVIFAGKFIKRRVNDWYQTPVEVKQILDGLLEISRSGFQARFQREAQSENPCNWFDWEEEEMLDWLTGYYNEMLEYYQDAVQRSNAILGNLSG
jgi:hypothetical protein